MNLMPQRWFHGSAWNSTIYGLTNGLLYREANESDGERQIGPYVLPAFQRPPVWKMSQKVRLIESIWAGLPIGSYVWNTNSGEGQCDGLLLDGQQRISAILEYVAGSFPVHGYLFTQLSKPEIMGFKMSSFQSWETKLDTMEKCLEIYDRLAYGGTPHKMKDRIAGNNP